MTDTTPEPDSAWADAQRKARAGLARTTNSLTRWQRYHDTLERHGRAFDLYTLEVQVADSAARELAGLTDADLY